MNSKKEAKKMKMTWKQINEKGLAIDLAAMPYLQNQNDQHGALDLVNDPVVSNPDAVGILLPRSLLTPGGKGFAANESIFSAIRDCTSLGRRRRARAAEGLNSML